jgi:hypothetical protein
MYHLTVNSLKNFLIVSLLTASTVLCTSPLAASQDNTGVLFSCDTSSGANIYVNRLTAFGKSVDLVLWKRGSRKERAVKCFNLDEKFKQFWRDERLNIIKSAKSRGSGRIMVCGLRSDNDPCNDASKLFDVQGLADQDAAKHLSCLLNGNCIGPIEQGSGDEFVGDFQAFIKKLRSQ